MSQEENDSALTTDQKSSFTLISQIKLKLLELHSRLNSSTATPKQDGTLGEKLVYFADLISTNTGLKRNSIIYGSSAIGTILLLRLMQSLIIGIVLDLVFIGYPSVKTLQSIPSSSTNDDACDDDDIKDDDVNWKVYWIFFALLGSVEKRFKTLIRFVPFYSGLKYAFLLGLIHPRVLGARLIYRKYLRQLYHEKQKEIIEKINEWSNANSIDNLNIPDNQQLGVDTAK